LIHFYKRGIGVVKLNKTSDFPRRSLKSPLRCLARVPLAQEQLGALARVALRLEPALLQPTHLDRIQLLEQQPSQHLEQPTQPLVSLLPRVGVYLVQHLQQEDFSDQQVHLLLPPLVEEPLVNQILPLELLQHSNQQGLALEQQPRHKQAGFLVEHPPPNQVVYLVLLNQHSQVLEEPPVLELEQLRSVEQMHLVLLPLHRMEQGMLSLIPLQATIP